MRRFLADTFAMITFSTVVGMVIELFVSGLTLGQSVQTRLTAIIPNMLTGRLQGIFRDWVFAKTGADKGGQILKGISDIIAFTFFQAPLYAVVLLTAGAEWEQILKACGTVALLSAFMGRPYGVFLDFSRWLFRIKKHEVAKEAA